MDTELETAKGLLRRVAGLVAAHSRATTTDTNSFHGLGLAIIGRRSDCVSLGYLFDRARANVRRLERKR